MLAFQYLGQYAMQSLMQHKDVAAQTEAFAKHLDEEKLKNALAVD